MSSSNSSELHNEKAFVHVTPDDGTSDQIQGNQGYLLDARVLQNDSETGGHGLKTASDGHTILIPQPSDDPNDTLNWTYSRKHLMLFVVVATAFLGEYGSASGVITSIPQSKEWHISQNTVLHSQAGNVFMLGAGGVVVVTAASYFGRLPVLFWFTLFTVWTAAFCAGAKTWSEYFAARILAGFFAPVAQAGALIFINDLFYVHEHARKINIWIMFIILPPYLAPLLSAFMLTKLHWQWPFWIYFIMTVICLVGIILFGEETYYDRRIPQDKQPARGSRIGRLIGTEQWKSRHLRNSALGALMRPVKTISKPTVFISCIYYFLTYAWVVGINGTLSIFLQPLYHFGPRQIGFFYFAPIVAVLLGFLAGHWIHDLVVNMAIKRNNGHLEPEARLWVMYISTPLMIAGLVFIGFCLERGYHYMLTALAWGLYVFGIVITTAAINAYNLTSYPEGSGEVAAWINFARMTGGFMVQYVQVEWAKKVGTERSFGTQAGIVAAAFLLIVLLQVFGKRLRGWSGPLNFSTN